MLTWRQIILKSVFKDHNNHTVNLSCRIDKDVYEILSKNADEKGISLNSLVNSMAKKFTSWEIHSSDIKLVSLSKEALEKIFNSLDDQAIQKIAKKIGGDVIREEKTPSSPTPTPTKSERLSAISSSSWCKISFSPKRRSSRTSSSPQVPISRSWVPTPIRIGGFRSDVPPFGSRARPDSTGRSSATSLLAWAFPWSTRIRRRSSRSLRASPIPTGTSLTRTSVPPGNFGPTKIPWQMTDRLSSSGMDFPRPPGARSSCRRSGPPRRSFRMRNSR